MRVNSKVLAGAMLCLLAVPEAALAWGPATHVGLARGILDTVSLLPIGVGVLLARHAAAYVFGNIAADIVFAKRLSRIKQFCHHWSTGFRLLDQARNDQGRAFAYGYLSHLAADTVAHGKYVPRQITVSGCSPRFGHLYWELRADAVVDEAHWQHLESVLGHDHAYHHATLEELITDTFLSYELNRMVFNRMHALAVRRTFRNTLTILGRCSRWYLSDALMNGYREECVQRIRSVLAEGPRSPFVREDPNGTSALMQLRVRRREHRRLRRQGIPLLHRTRELSQALGPWPATALPVCGQTTPPIAEPLAPVCPA